jgi:hypothetical protein
MGTTSLYSDIFTYSFLSVDYFLNASMLTLMVSTVYKSKSSIRSSFISLTSLGSALGSLDSSFSIFLSYYLNPEIRPSVKFNFGGNENL